MSKDTFQNLDGSTTIAHWDDKGVTVEHKQRVDHIMDGFREESAMGHNKIAAGRLAARVPITTHFEWVREWQENHSDKWELKTYLAMKVNSPDFKKLRNQVIRG